jgi:hypothetical protein
MIQKAKIAVTILNLDRSTAAFDLASTWSTRT